MSDWQKDYSFLKDPDLSPELKALLVEKASAEKLHRAELASKDRTTRADRSLERQKFWQNTPLVVALVGLITIAANAGSSYFLSDQTAINKAEDDERAFAFNLIATELSKTAPDDTVARAQTLLFLVRAGLLDSLDRPELEAMANADLEAAGVDPSTVTTGIPPTLGLQGLPSYSLPLPPPNPAQTAAAGRLLAAAVGEINRNIEENVSAERVREYWRAVDFDPGPNLATVPWSSTFLAWLIKESGNPDGLALSARGTAIWNDAVKKRLSFLPGEKPPLPGDIVFMTRQGADPADLRGGTSDGPTHPGVVYAVNGSSFSSIEGNTGNAIRLREHTLSDNTLIGFIRLGVAPATAEE